MAAVSFWNLFQKFLVEKCDILPRIFLYFKCPWSPTAAFANAVILMEAVCTASGTELGVWDSWMAQRCRWELTVLLMVSNVWLLVGTASKEKKSAFPGGNEGKLNTHLYFILAEPNYCEAWIHWLLELEGFERSSCQGLFQLFLAVTFFSLPQTLLTPWLSCCKWKYLHRASRIMNGGKSREKRNAALITNELKSET